MSLSFSSFVLFRAESFDTGLFPPAFLGKASPRTGQARVGKTELKNKCTQIFRAVPVSLLSFTATDGYGPPPLQLFTVTITAQVPMLPSHEGPTTLSNVLRIRKDHTSTVYLTSPFALQIVSQS